MINVITSDTIFAALGGKEISVMGKIRRGNYLFLTYKMDHPPRHVHVYKDERVLGKWDLEKRRVLEGKISRRVRKIINKLVQEGKL